jgi:glycosyltransferase involved in cell wall biosynthesis
VKTLLLSLAKKILRRLPLTDSQRLQLVSYVFDLTGDKLAFLPSYQLYLRNRKWLRAPIPANLAAARAEMIAQYFQTPDFQTPAAKTMVMISHSLGGGTQQHLDDMISRLEAEGWRIFLLQRHNHEHLRLMVAGYKQGGPLFYRWAEDVDALAQDFLTLGVTHLHLHHTVDFPTDFLVHFRAMIAQTQIPFDYTVHDYFSICPRFTLFDEAVRGYCGEPSDVRKCSACVKTFGSAVGKEQDVAKWREDYGALLQEARQVFVPDTDVAMRLTRYFPEVGFTVHPHLETKPFLAHSVAAIRAAGEPLRVAVIGGIAPHKGSKVLWDCAEDALKRNLPLEFTLIGYSDIDHKLKGLKNVTVTGHFQAESLTKMLQDGQYHLAFLPSVIPETYNYVLSECWRHGLYVVGFAIGAIASRIHAAPDCGAVLPLEWYVQPEKINAALLNLTILPVDGEKRQPSFASYPSLTRDYYGLE